MIMMNKILEEDLTLITNQSIDWKKIEGKNILISGANGFLPSYIVYTIVFLKKRNIINNVKLFLLVRNIDKAKCKFDCFADIIQIEYLNQDVCDKVHLNDKVHFIIHAASQASPKYYGLDPVGTLSANVLGTINLLEFARRNPVESFLYFSSSEVYGAVESNEMPISEENYGYLNPANVRACYGESKRMGETICVSYYHQYQIPTKIVRPFHTYGPGMSFDDGRVFADFAADIINNRNIVLNSDGLATRAFCYLSDATVAFFKILFEGKSGDAYNMGNPECEISIIDLAKLLVDLFPERNLSVVQNFDKSKGYIASSVNRNYPSVEKLNKLGWIPNVSIEEGFKRTICSYEY